MSLDSRNRMISFRLSVEEYEKFRELCFTSGIRSISELARVAINNFLSQSPQSTSQSALDVRVSDLEARLHVLAGELKRQKENITGGSHTRVRRGWNQYMTTPSIIPSRCQPRIQSLDGVRGLALLTVLIFHTLPIAAQPSSALTTLWNGVAKSCWVGVDLFFVLSGFLITSVLCEAKGKPNYFLDFYLRRILRIAPLYYAVIFAALHLIPLLFGPFLPPIFHRIGENQIWLWTFTQNFLQARGQHQIPGFGHFWTLAVEAQFYLIWPVLVFWLSRKKLLLLCLATCLLEPMLRFVCLHSAGYTMLAVRQLTYLRIDTILYGSLLYLLIAQNPFNLFGGSASFANRIFIAIGAFALTAIVWIVFQNSALPYEAKITDVIGYSAVAILSAILLYACLFNQFRVGDFFANPILRWFGKYSYGIYIFSIPCILCFQTLLTAHHWLRNPLLSASICFLCVGIGSTSLAYLSWHLLESPALQLQHSRWMTWPFLSSAQKETAPADSSI